MAYDESNPAPLTRRERQMLFATDRQATERLCDEIRQRHAAGMSDMNVAVTLGVHISMVQTVLEQLRPRRDADQGRPVNKIQIQTLCGVTINDCPIDLTRLTVGELQLLTSLLEKAMPPNASGPPQLVTPKRL